METPPSLHNRSVVGHWFRLAIACAALAMMACSRPPWPPEVDQSESIRARLDLRHSEMKSATYRVRWEARGTEPHGQFILRLAYRSPDLFYVSGLGPLDIPAFTGVVRGDEFWFIDHYNKEYFHDQVANLDQYDVPLSAFFTTLWRDLFSGGWGGDAGYLLRPSDDTRGWYSGSDGESTWSVKWDGKDRAPSRVIVEIDSDGDATTAEIRYHWHQREFPYWEMEAIELLGYPGGGRHTWKFLDQRYNVDIPERFFTPLDPASVDDK